MRTLLLTIAALIGFCANSLLTRGALASGRLDPATFTAVRLATGAVTLVLLLQVRPHHSRAENGSWWAAAVLAAYAVLFTLAYGRINASVGALVLFGAVQVTMIGTGLVRGERPARVDWAGVALALAGLLVFTVPGVNEPDPLGTAFMAGAGVCWGVYSLAGRGATDPLAATAGNFVRATLAGLVFAFVAASARHVTSSGLLLAGTSGSLASGVGYTFWYAALPKLAAWRAAVVQLVVPVLTAVSATVLLGESLTLRLVIATLCVVAGVGLTVLPALHRRLA